MKKAILTLIGVSFLTAERVYSQIEYTETGLKFNHSNFIRTNISLSLNPEQYRILTYRDIFNKYGILLDDQSKIFTHTEENLIDLQCFDCIIRSRDYNAAVDNPENDIVKSRGRSRTE